MMDPLARSFAFFSFFFIWRSCTAAALCFLGETRGLEVNPFFLTLLRAAHSRLHAEQLLPADLWGIVSQQRYIAPLLRAAYQRPMMMRQLKDSQGSCSIWGRPAESLSPERPAGRLVQLAIRWLSLVWDEWDITKQPELGAELIRILGLSSRDDNPVYVLPRYDPCKVSLIHCGVRGGFISVRFLLPPGEPWG